MTALWPHIRVPRAEAEALHIEANRLGNTAEQITAALVLLSITNAKLTAADEIEAEQRALLEKVAGGGSEG